MPYFEWSLCNNITERDYTPTLKKQTHAVYSNKYTLTQLYTYHRSYNIAVVTGLLLTWVLSINHYSGSLFLPSMVVMANLTIHSTISNHCILWGRLQSGRLTADDTKLRQTTEQKRFLRRLTSLKSESIKLQLNHINAVYYISPAQRLIRNI